MALRPTWKGALKLRLISIPIRVYPATESQSSTSFRQLHRKCHTPIQLKKWCPVCDQEVSNDQIVRGYEVEHGHYVLMEDKEIAAARPAATHTIELGQVIDGDALDPLLLERAYYLAPEGQTAGEPFAVIREALGGRAAIGRLALYGREYLVAVVAREDGLVMYTLRQSKAVRSISKIDELAGAHTRVKSDEVALAKQVLDSLKTGRTLTDYTDHYEQAISKLVEKKLASEPPLEIGKRDERSTAPRKVVNLMDALRQSLERSAGGRTAAPRAGMRPATVIAHPSHAKARPAKAAAARAHTPHRRTRRAS